MSPPLIRSHARPVIPYMPNIGPMEILIVLIVALVIFGPKRIPELGRSVGNGIREFRGTVSGEQAALVDSDATPARKADEAA